MVSEDTSEAVRRKSIYALSSGIRNYQPGLDEAIKALPKTLKPDRAVDAGDMEDVDRIVAGLREASKI